MNEFDLSHNYQRFSSRVLWHFTGYGKTPAKAFEILNIILTEGCLKVGSHPEDIIMHDKDRRQGYPFSCVCDIPFKIY
jgi:hypothetical protein